MVFVERRGVIWKCLRILILEKKIVKIDGERGQRGGTRLRKSMSENSLVVRDVGVTKPSIKEERL